MAEDDAPSVAAVPDDGLEVLADSKWQRTVTRVSKAVVVIRTTGTRAFDTEAASSAYATGFVVDKARGILLTNRHVLRPGPCVAEAVFQNREEVPLRALYADPVHDFAFFRFDPRAVAFHAPEEIALKPDGASVGLEVRVVGNDSGEKLSILSATLARLDRDAPKYGGKTYNDFNTFYVQAASGTKGGSSGSPVVDENGDAVALNAGSKNKGSSAYYLPLHRVQRALERIQSSNPSNLPTSIDVPRRAPDVPRGTLQATFAYRGFDDLRRMGLDLETEKALRDVQKRKGQNTPGVEGTGALAVEDTTPGGPCEDAGVNVGDVLVKIGDAFVTDFVRLERLLDESVGASVVLTLDRAGVTITKRLIVQDLHAITPARFLEAAGGIVHALSYQQARNFQLAAGSPYVAEPGYALGLAGVPKHAIITSLDNTPTPDLGAFAEAFARFAKRVEEREEREHDGETLKTSVKYFTRDERHRTKTSTFRAHFAWHPPPAFFDRDWRTGIWNKTLLSDAIRIASSDVTRIPDSATTTLESERNGTDAAAATFAAGGEEASAPNVRLRKRKRNEDGSIDPSDRFETEGKEKPSKPSPSLAEAVALDLEPSLCVARCDIASVALADGVYSRSFEGNGLVLHHDPDGSGVGLVAVDRNTVPISSCDVLLTFAAYPHEVAANVEFLHPTKNFALVSYDARAMPRAARLAVRAAACAGGDDESSAMRRGDELVLVGLNAQLKPMSRVATVADATSSAAVPSADIPRFRAVNEEVVKLDIDLGYDYGGALAVARYGKAENGGGGADALATAPRAVVKALWASYATPTSDGEVDSLVRGMPIAPALEARDRVLAWMAASGDNKSKQSKNESAAPDKSVKLLDAEFEVVTLSRAANLGVPRAWIDALLAKDPGRRQALVVASTVAGTGAARTLEGGDVVLTAGAGKGVCVTFGDCERAVSSDLVSETRENSTSRQNVLPMTVCRSGAILEVEVETSDVSCVGTSRLTHWAGCILQAAHRPVAELGFAPVWKHPETGAETKLDVFVSRWFHGSPAHRYGVYALHWVAEVNDTPAPTLDAFIAIVKDLPDGQFVRLKLVSLQGRPKALTVKLDAHYWPTWELRRDEGGKWERVLL
jgi:S1-C subfamily serine protease